MFLTLFILIASLFNQLTGIILIRQIIYLFGDEYNNYRSGSGSPGTCDFLFYPVNYVVRVSGVGSGIFVLTGIKSIGDVVPLVCLYQEELSPKVVDS